MKLLALFFSSLMLLAMPSICPADSVSETNSNSDYVRVEVRGTLSTGVMAIGAETTGTTSQASNVTWELDFGDRKDLRELASKLDKQKVVVTGNYQKVRGVEIRERHLVKVTALKRAD
jgi:hypothetical protein